MINLSGSYFQDSGVVTGSYFQDSGVATDPLFFSHESNSILF